VSESSVLHRIATSFRNLAATGNSRSSKALQGTAKNFRELAIAEGRRVREALQQSDKKLSPLGDPLRVTLSDHRWLRYDREESYSDWLAWVATTMCPEQILGLLGLGNERELAAVVRGHQAKVAREIVIETSDGPKRLDLVIRFGTVATFLIEIKRTSYGRAGNLRNLELYGKWLDKEPGQKEGKKAVLLVTERTEGEATEIGARWQLLTWRAVSLALRRHAAQVCESGKAADLLKPGLWLCLAGAIEQNLLGFEVAATGYSPSAPRTKRYLEEFLS
jgi:hypothetical protein